MIKYNLICKCQHVFDSWFINSKEFERLKKKKLITCSVCGSYFVNKSIMSPNLSSKVRKNLKLQKLQKEVKNKLVEYTKYIKNNFEYVGKRFVQEARSIHYDKKTSKGIYGKATKEECDELEEEGIETSTIPWVDKLDN